MPQSTPLVTYLRELRDGRAIGVAETSFYGPLATLLNTIGATLKPRVRCIIHPKGAGAGIPDGGFYTPDQLPRSADAAAIAAQIPSRGVLEAKGTAEQVERIAASPQVAKYLARYGQVLVTNYRDFLLVGRDGAGQPHQLERYRLAPSEAAFWSASPEQLAAEHEERLAEYLKRVMLSNAPLADPKDVAWFLASYARDARTRVEHAQLPALDLVRAALEEALGITFQGERGDHFFRSTLVQTLFYGVFSAWVLWCKDHTDPAARFDWRAAAYYLRVPMIEALFNQVAAPNRLRPLGLMEVLDWTAAALNRVDRASFFDRFEDGQAVQYFYEPFLEAFDPQLRKDLGVWYTPPEIVKYQVARVDTALREELGIADGLADERVVILDPCCGTGAYLVEVLQRIATTLRAQGGDALLADDLKRAARERVFGFELLPAPFVVAHLQLGLLLTNLGAPLADEGERVGVYLTNALTGWEPPDAEKDRVIQLQLAGMPELQQERDLARHVKRDEQILVILGNPPYSGYAGLAIGEERDLSNAYRSTKRAPRPQGQGLNDLYVRFFRMAERRIVEQSGRGIVCFISNYSWLDGLSFTGMRERYLEVFDQIWIDNLNGDKYKTGKLTPEGLSDPSVFSTPFNPEGIQVGTAIALLVRRPSPPPSPTGTGASALTPALSHGERESDRPLVRRPSPPPSPTGRGSLIAPPPLGSEATLPLGKESNLALGRESNRPSPGGRGAGGEGTSGRGAGGEGTIRFRNLWGKQKRPELLDSATQDGEALYQQLRPPLAIGLPFMPTQVEANYTSWPLLPELFPTAFPGVKTSRDDVVVDIDRDRLERRMRQYFDPTISHEEMRRIAPGAMESTPEFKAEQVRDYLRRRGFLPENILRYCYRPFDVRWLYWEPETKLLDRNRAEYFTHVFEGNAWIEARQKQPMERFDRGYVVKVLSDNFGNGLSTYFPLSLKNERISLFDHDDARDIKPNLSDKAAAYLAGLALGEQELFYHTIATLHAPAYRAENAGALRQDWPRVPLPSAQDALRSSAALGRQVAALLDSEHAVAGVSAGAPRPELRTIGAIARMGGGQLQPTAGDLDLTAGWGHAGQGGVTMPGKGRLIARDYAPDELAAYEAGATALGLTSAQIRALLGEHTCDVYLNGVAYWKNIPQRVWDYTIGGYQVIKKWLSYRERPLLGRSLTVDEVREVGAVARRIAALLLLAPMLDANYRAVKAATVEWVTR